MRGLGVVMIGGTAGPAAGGLATGQVAGSHMRHMPIGMMTHGRRMSLWSSRTRARTR